MSITFDDLDFLTSDAGARVLARLAGEDLRDEYTLSLLTALRREVSAQQAGAALELARLRKKAVGKFGDDAAKMYFTREALEQASDPLIRAWRAAGWRAQPFGGRVVDACCGIGADSIAFAQAGGDVIGLEIDPLRVAMARLNTTVLGLSVRFEAADVRENIPEAELIFFDPGRRGEQGKRIFDVEHYEPPLSTLRNWKTQTIIAKLSPGIDLAQLEAYGGCVSFVSVDGALKEADLMIDARLGSARYRAVLIEGNSGAVSVWERAAEQTVSAPIHEPRGWLIEPDAAIIRAGLVTDLALDIGGAQLDAEIAYITTETKPNSPWVRSWKIIDWMPFNLKKLRAYLRERNVGRVTVKKRGTAVTPEELIAKLRLNGNESRTVVLTRCRGEHVAVVCDDLTIEQGG